MTGRIENLHVFLPVVLRLPAQPDLSLEFVVDTGFTGELTLPPAAVTAMGLPFAYSQAVTLANDSDVEVPVHQATIVWQESERLVHIFATGNRPLLGTALLAGCELLVGLHNTVK
jgi:clan AA aspartic protease